MTGTNETGRRKRNITNKCTTNEADREERFSPKRKREKPRWTKEEKKERSAALKQEAPNKTRNKKRKQNEREIKTLDFLAHRYQRKKIMAKLLIHQQKRLGWAKRIRLVAEAASFTGSVKIIEGSVVKKGEGDGGVQVVTTTQANDALTQNASFASIMARIYVKPLLILDINGILCHRIRDRTLPSTAYRVGLDKPIAMTNIVLRPMLCNFLDVVFENFCVGIWTSAKRRTAQELVNKIIPHQHRSKLLFVWHQTDCTCKSSKHPDDEVEETIYQKDLLRVWHCFPLWNTFNTVLVDDSPQKGNHDSQGNMVNPIPLHGRVAGQLSNDQFLSDEENVEQQQRFFDSLVGHWKTNSTVEQWESGIDLSVLRSSGNLSAFLHEQCAINNIGRPAEYDDYQNAIE